MGTIYLDHAATTPLDPRVLSAMMPFLKEEYGNPSSSHRLGEQAKDAIEKARQVIAKSVQARPEQVIFTSGGTESDNMGVRIAWFSKTQSKKVAISSIEHPAVRDAAFALKSEGFNVVEVPVSSDGLVRCTDDLGQLIKGSSLVAVMHVNNEVGTIQPIDQIAKICAEQGVPFFCDSVQSFLKLPVSIKTTGISALSISAHKINGPKGVGAFIASNQCPESKILFGGDQEFDRRAGTPSVANIVGFAKAIEIQHPIDDESIDHLKMLRDRLMDGILDSIQGSSVNGSRMYRVCNNANVSIKDMEARSLLEWLDSKGVCASIGSACSSSSLEPSHVLKALGISTEQALGSLRFTIGQSNTKEEIESVIELLQTRVQELRI